MGLKIFQWGVSDQGWYWLCFCPITQIRCWNIKHFTEHSKKGLKKNIPWLITGPGKGYPSKSEKYSHNNHPTPVKYCRMHCNLKASFIRQAKWQMHISSSQGCDKVSHVPPSIHQSVVREGHVKNQNFLCSMNSWCWWKEHVRKLDYTVTW